MPHPDWPSVDQQRVLCAQAQAAILDLLRPYQHLPLDALRSLHLTVVTVVSATVLTEMLLGLAPEHQELELGFFLVRVRAIVTDLLLAERLTGEEA